MRVLPGKGSNMERETESPISPNMHMALNRLAKQMGREEWETRLRRLKAEGLLANASSIQEEALRETSAYVEWASEIAFAVVYCR